MLNFNELLMTEKFINEVFGDLECLLQEPEVPREDGKVELEPADASKDILHTYAQLYERESANPRIRGSMVREQLL